MRITEVDAVRGFAVVLMIVYHLLFDISFFGVFRIDMTAIGMVLLQRVIATLFLIIVGVSLVLSESENREGYLKHLKRAAFLFGVGLLITLATLLFSAEMFISFGVIHMIALSVAISPLFFRAGRWNLFLGLGIIILGSLFAIPDFEQWYLGFLGTSSPAYTPFDYYPMFPWFGLVLIGIFIGQTVFPEGRKTNARAGYIVGALAFPGRHALAIYLLHQPVLLALIMATTGAMLF